MINLLPSIWGLVKALLMLSKEQDVLESFEHQTEIIRRAAVLLEDITQNFDENRDYKAGRGRRRDCPSNCPKA